MNVPGLILAAFVFSVFGVGLGLLFFPKLRRRPGRLVLLGLGLLTLATGIGFFIIWRSP